MGDCIFDTPSVKVYVGYGDYSFAVYVDGERERAFRFQDEAIGYAESRAMEIGDYAQRKWDTCPNCGAELVNGYCPDCGANMHRSNRKGSEMKMRKRSYEYGLDVIEARLLSYLEDLDDDALAEIWNQLCEDNRWYEDMLLPNDEDEFNNIVGDKTPYDVATSVSLRDWFAEDKYLTVDGYGDPVSYNSAADKVDFDELVNSIIRDNDDFGDSDIRDILDETEDEREASRKRSAKRKAMKKRAVNGFPDWDDLPDWAKNEFENFVNKTYLNENRMNYDDDLIVVKTPSGDVAFKGLVDEGKDIYDDFNDFRFDSSSNMYFGNGAYSGWTVKVVAAKKAMKRRAQIWDNSEDEFLNVGDHFTMGDWGGEPIEWRVLAVERDRVLVISERGIDCEQFNSSRAKGNGWETSDLRAWLEREFLPGAFSSDEQCLIREVTCLSVDEALRYFSGDNDRRCHPSDYAKAQGVWTSWSGSCYWRLRSPGSDGSECAAFVDDGGYVDTCGSLVDGNNYAVRPALWL